MSFSELGLIPPILRALSDEGYVTPTPIQQQAIPFVLAGKDLLGLAQTGTGKTAAFSLPLLQRLSASPRTSDRRVVRALVVSPTRELASQIGDSIAAYGRHLDLTHAVIFGGVGMGAQEQSLRRGVDIVVATPGRLLDHLNKRILRLDSVETFVLDEADRMLDMGFIPDVRRIVNALPKKRQNLFFSATMPREAATLAQQLLHEPARVSVVPPATTVDKVEQFVYFVSANDKRTLLVDLLADRALARVLIFTRTKRGADRVAKHLRLYGTMAEVIHGDRTQGAREKALAAFKSGKARVLVATDIAARGIDVDDVTHVINYELPNVPESYVHRIGRTARAGASGSAVSLCAPDERPYLADIEKVTRKRVTVLATPRLQHAAPMPATPASAPAPAARRAEQPSPPRRAESADARTRRPPAARPSGSTSRALPGERLSGDLSS